MASFTAAERRRIAAALVESSAPSCPACGERLDVRPVEPPKSVSYVRRRLWLLCPGCRKTGAVDVTDPAP